MQHQQIQAEPFPPVLNALDLGRLLNKNPSAIFADRSRAPWRLPPACTPPGTKSPLWLLDDVLAWLREHREQRKPAHPAPDAPAPTKRRRGRPTKAEQIARRPGAQEGGAQ